MITHTSSLAFLVVARRFTAEDWQYNLRLLDTRACELGGQACKNLREKIETWKQLLFPERVTARKNGRGFSFSLAAITGIAEYLKSDMPESWRGLTLHRMLSSLYDFYRAAIRRASRDLEAEKAPERAPRTARQMPPVVAADQANEVAVAPPHPSVFTERVYYHDGKPLPSLFTQNKAHG